MKLAFVHYMRRNVRAKLVLLAGPTFKLPAARAAPIYLMSRKFQIQADVAATSQNGSNFA